VLTVTQAADLLLEQALPPFLALDERQLRSALAIQKQKIEGEEDELISEPSASIVRRYRCDQ
jgi:hypothetical protein